MSRGLGQGELLEMAPERAVIVPEGHVAWWGVDPSTLRVSIATVSAEGCRGVSTRSFARRRGAERLADIFRETRLLACELIGAGVCPGVVVVEQPSGKVQNLELVYAVGVIQAALAAACCPGTHFEMVASSRWKAVACGKGNIYKPKRERGGPAPQAEDYAVLAWARSLGYRGSSWDEADAMGVAEWARRTFSLSGSR